MSQPPIPDQKANDDALSRLADRYETSDRDQVLRILKQITDYSSGTISRESEWVPINSFVDIHDEEFGLALGYGHKLVLSDLKEFLNPTEVEPSGRSTRGGPDTTDHSRRDEDQYAGRYGVWSEVRERMDEEGRNI